MNRIRRFHAPIALAAFGVLAVVWTWPLAALLSSRIPLDLRDPLFVTWVLWWNAHTAPLSAAWWNAPILFPVENALAFSEHLAGIGVFASPILWTGGTPLVAYNLSLLLSYALSGWFSYLLVERLTGSALAGACAGLVFGFGPYRASQLDHLQVLTSQWMPAMLLGLHAYVSTGRAAWLALFGAAWALQALSNGYYLLFVPVLLAMWVVWFVDWRRSRPQGIAIVVTWAMASLSLLPILLKYRHVHTAFGFSRSHDEVMRFSATLGSFVNAAPLLAFWRSYRMPITECYLYPGITAVTLVASALIATATWRRSTEGARDRPLLLFYTAAMLLMWALTLGPGPADGSVLNWLRPYRWVALLPGYTGLRVPARFAMLGSVCLSVAVGLAVARLSVVAGRWRIAVAAALLAGLTVDGWMRVLPMLTPPEPLAIAAEDPESIVIELPPDDSRTSIFAMYHAMSHGKRIVNGYTGYTPAHYIVLCEALRRGDLSPLLYFARGRPLIVVATARTPIELRNRVPLLPGVETVAVNRSETIYRLPAQPVEPSRPAGQPRPIHSQEVGGDRLIVDLGRVDSIGVVKFALRDRYAQFSDRLVVETSEDGNAWTEAWRGWTGAPALAAALENPLIVPVRIPLPDVRARYVRISPAPQWLAGEVAVEGK